MVSVACQHLVCVSNVFSSSDVAEVNDSMQRLFICIKNKSSSNHASLSQYILLLENVDIQLIVLNFAMAFVLSICMHEYPHTKIYHQTAMHYHFIQCCEKKQSFPSKHRKLGRNGTITQQKIEVFCVCHLPLIKYDTTKGPLLYCNRCKEWYHEKWMDIDKLTN